MWIAIGGALLEVDPHTGSVIGGFGLVSGLRALAADGDHLFGFCDGSQPPPSPDPPPPLRVVKLDLATGEVEMLAPLSGIDSAAAIRDLVIDRHGLAWILAGRTIPGPPPVNLHELYRSFDLETGVVEFVSAGSEPGASGQPGAMDLVPDRRIVEIPTLGWGGLVVFCAALIGCGLRFLRSRPRD